MCDFGFMISPGFVIFLSIHDLEVTHRCRQCRASPAPRLPAGWRYHCSASSLYQRISTLERRHRAQSCKARHVRLHKKDWQLFFHNRLISLVKVNRSLSNVVPEGGCCLVTWFPNTTVPRTWLVRTNNNNNLIVIEEE